MSKHSYVKLCKTRKDLEALGLC